MKPHWSALSALAAALASLTPASAQPEDALPESAPAIERIAAAYRDAPLAERTRLTFAGGGPDAPPAVAPAVAVVRIDPAGAIRLELDGLTLWAGDGVIEGVIDANRGAYFAAPIDDAPLHEALMRHLPWTPLPQPGLAFAPAPALQSVLPFSGSIVWRRASGLADDPAVIVARGETDALTISLVANAATGRLREGTLAPAGGPVHHLSVTPIEPGDPAQWRPDTTARQRVSTLAELAPGTADIEPGDAAPELLLLTLDGRPWRLSEARGGPVALLLFRTDSPEARAGRDALRRLAAAHPALSARYGAVLDQRDEDVIARRDELAGRWGDELLWTVSHDSTIDPFAPNAGAAIVLIDAAGVVRGVVPLDERAGDVDELTEETGELLEL